MSSIYGVAWSLNIISDDENFTALPPGLVQRLNRNQQVPVLNPLAALALGADKIMIPASLVNPDFLTKR
jgi:hypothetical protein